MFVIVLIFAVDCDKLTTACLVLCIYTCECV